MTKGHDSDCHFAASTLAAIVNFPLWRASAIAQSGFKLEGANVFVRYYKAVVHPPFRGMLATILGMSWARGAIFGGSEWGTEKLKRAHVTGATAHVLPPLVIGTLVQIVNMPLVRSTITIQDPHSNLPNVRSALIYLYKTKGFLSLWHGVSAGIMKTVPKYVTAVGVKDIMEDRLPRPDPSDKTAVLSRSAIKSVTAGVAGAVLTNPLDVLRNEMFKTDLSLSASFQKLMKEQGWSFMARGVTSNTTAVAIPIALTIFFTDYLISWKHRNEKQVF